MKGAEVEGAPPSSHLVPKQDDVIFSDRRIVYRLPHRQGGALGSRVWAGAHAGAGAALHFGQDAQHLACDLGRLGRHGALHFGQQGGVVAGGRMRERGDDGGGQEEGGHPAGREAGQGGWVFLSGDMRT